MADSELEALRAKRMAELQQQYGMAGGGDEQKKQEEMLKREAEMKNAMLSQLLDQSARARLNSIALVKPEKAKMVESMLIQMSQRGQIVRRIDEEQLVSLLHSVSSQTQKTTTVKYERRKVFDSDEDD